MENFGEKLKSLRQEHRLTQDELARELEKAGCSAGTKSAISQYENNKRYPEVKALAIIAKYFDVSADYLLGLDGSDYAQEQVWKKYRTLGAEEKAMASAYITALFDKKK